MGGQVYFHLLPPWPPSLVASRRCTHSDTPTYTHPCTFTTTLTHNSQTHHHTLTYTFPHTLIVIHTFPPTLTCRHMSTCIPTYTQNYTHKVTGTPTLTCFHNYLCIFAHTSDTFTLALDSHPHTFFLRGHTRCSLVDAHSYPALTQP